MGSPIPDELTRHLVRVSEAGAIAAAPWIGKEDKNAADGDAVAAMRLAFREASFDGVVVMGEGTKDDAPMFDHGEAVGAGDGPSMDVAIDPIDGTALVAAGQHGAISVLAASDRHSLLNWRGLAYVEKIVVGPAGVGVIDLNAGIAQNIGRLARALNTSEQHITVAVLDRERHRDLILEASSTGANIQTIAQGDVIPALMCALPDSGIDLLMGIGGSPEAVITACAIKCLGGDMQCRYWIKDDFEAELAQRHRLDVQHIMTLPELVGGRASYFAATGITDGPLLNGVVTADAEFRTDSIVVSTDRRGLQRIKTTHPKPAS